MKIRTVAMSAALVGAALFAGAGVASADQPLECYRIFGAQAPALCDLVPSYLPPELSVYIAPPPVVDAPPVVVDPAPVVVDTAPVVVDPVAPADTAPAVTVDPVVVDTAPSVTVDVAPVVVTVDTAPVVVATP